MITQVLAQTPFNYSYLVGGATEDLIVADRIPVDGARTVALSVRIHELTLTSGAGFRFLVYGLDPSKTDGSVFITSATIGDTGLVTSATPNLVGLASLISDPIYPFVRVVLRAQGPSATGTTYFEVSADLVVRQAAPQPAACKVLVQHVLAGLYKGGRPVPGGMLSGFGVATDPLKGNEGGTSVDTYVFKCPGPSTPPGEGGGGSKSWDQIIADAAKAVSVEGYC